MKSGLQQLVRLAGLSIGEEEEERQPRNLRQEGKAIGAEMELEELLATAGSALSQSSSSLDELFSLLDQIEGLLLKAEQSPADSMQNVLSPIMQTLIADKFLKHSDTDIKAGVASCISKIIRGTAPVAPNDDERMKEVFQLIVTCFADFSDTYGGSYHKMASILKTMAKIRYCLITLDLGCEQMIIEMFHHFLGASRVNHLEIIFESMKTVMNLVLEESEDMASVLIMPLTAARNDEEIQLNAKKLAVVIQNCTEMLGPYLTKHYNLQKGGRWGGRTSVFRIVFENPKQVAREEAQEFEESEQKGWILTIKRYTTFNTSKIIGRYSGRKAVKPDEFSVVLMKRQMVDGVGAAWFCFL